METSKLSIVAQVNKVDTELVCLYMDILLASNDADKLENLVAEVRDNADLYTNAKIFNTKKPEFILNEWSSFVKEQPQATKTISVLLEQLEQANIYNLDSLPAWLYMGFECEGEWMMWKHNKARKGA